MITYVLLILGFVCLVKGADWFVDGCSSIAKLLKVPSIIIGLTIVAMGTSLPEAAVSITAGLEGSNDIAISNVIGSNLFNLLMVLGVCSAISPIHVTKSILKVEFPFSIIIAALTAFMGLDMIFGRANAIGRVDGLILLGCFAGFLAYMIRSALKNKTEEEEEVKTMSPFLSIVCVVIGAAIIIVGGNLVVDNAVIIAASFGLSETFIGLTIVAMGTSLPELVTSIVASRKGENDLAVGNVVGSNIFNLLLILGASSAISPVAVKMESIYDLVILIVLSIVTLIFCKQKDELSRKEGLMMVAMYAVYMVYITMR